MAVADRISIACREGGKKTHLPRWEAAGLFRAGAVAGEGFSSKLKASGAIPGRPACRTDGRALLIYTGKPSPQVHSSLGCCQARTPALKALHCSYRLMWPLRRSRGDRLAFSKIHALPDEGGQPEMESRVGSPHRVQFPARSWCSPH